MTLFSKFLFEMVFQYLSHSECGKWHGRYNTGRKLSIKFGGSQGAQDIIDKMTPALLPKFTNSKIKIGTIVTVSQDFSNLSGIWNG